MATFWPGLTPAGQVIQKHAVPGGDGGIAAWFGFCFTGFGGSAMGVPLGDLFYRREVSYLFSEFWRLAPLEGKPSLDCR